MSASQDIQKTRFKSVATITVSFLLVFLLIHILNVSLNMSLNDFGLEPRTLRGLIGIFTAPLLHGDWAHLIGNSMSFAALAGMLFYFYPKLSFRIMGISWISIGILVWLTGRPSIHVGASGVIYAFAAFLFLSGIIRRHYQLMAVSLIVVFLYGSMVWGILPGQPGISWESHLSGMLVGLGLAVYYRKQGPQKPIPSWETEDEDEEEDPFLQVNSSFHTNHSLYQDVEIHYKQESSSGVKAKDKKQTKDKANKETRDGFMFSPKGRKHNR
ncbi:MAG: rhomboid family intramembrane serine protease [Bacteroidales bacterium]|jgi:membrane associated rhomboid family serine protease|nr:rhomboid family intramembrane serine protease [Bacteroidales bacterium]